MKVLQDGFTLMEVLVALVVLGFVLAGLGQATRFGIHAWDLETRLADNAAELERVDRVLRNLIEQAAPPLDSDQKPFAGQEHRLVFVTRLPDQPETQPIRRAQVAIGVDDHQRLVLRWQPHPNAVALNRLADPKEIVLAEGVDHLDLAYRQAAGDGGKWMRAWSDSPLPALVEMRITLSGDKRRWPVFFLPTALDTNGSF